VGATTYSLTCANAAGSSTANSVTLTTVAAGTGGGGGGDLEWLTLAALLAACVGQLALAKGRVNARVLAKWKASRSAATANRINISR
jgi:hypothetical protein